VKKILLILLAAIFIAGCSDNDEDTTSNTQREKKDEETRIFQIGETADITTDSAGIPYQVTVNSFELTTDSVDGVSLEDYNITAEDGGEFAVVNVTLKNTGDSSFVPQGHISAILEEQDSTSFYAVAETFNERLQEIKPGEEITGNLVYTSTYFDDFDVLYLTYETEAIDNETMFELSMP
jgi:hypothetical protein